MAYKNRTRIGKHAVDIKTHQQWEFPKSPGQVNRLCWD